MNNREVEARLVKRINIQCTLKTTYQFYVQCTLSETVSCVENDANIQFSNMKPLPNTPYTAQNVHFFILLLSVHQ